MKVLKSMKISLIELYVLHALHGDNIPSDTIKSSATALWF